MSVWNPTKDIKEKLYDFKNRSQEEMQHGKERILRLKNWINLKFTACRSMNAAETTTEGEKLLKNQSIVKENPV